jgi:hypothetical protein
MARKRRKLSRKETEKPDRKPVKKILSKNGINPEIEDIFQKALSEAASEREGVREDGIKEIYEYPDAQCAYPGCPNKAVGADDVCEQHGGNPIIKDNLLLPEEVPDWIANMHTYDPAKHPMGFIMLSKEGYSEVEIAAEFNVSVGVMRGWAEKFLDFNTAYEIGKAAHESWWLKEGKNNLDNRSYNVSLFKFLTGNKLGYSDKIESKNLNVHAGVLLVPGTQNASEWEEQGRKLMEDRGNGS